MHFCCVTIPYIEIPLIFFFLLYCQYTTRQRSKIAPDTWQKRLNVTKQRNHDELLCVQSRLCCNLYMLQYWNIKLLLSFRYQWYSCALIWILLFKCGILIHKLWQFRIIHCWVVGRYSKTGKRTHVNDEIMYIFNFYMFNYLDNLFLWFISNHDSNFVIFVLFCFGFCFVLDEPADQCAISDQSWLT